jgi:hypothetical protein
VAQAAEVEVVLLHVSFADSLPMFDDHRGHETADWMDEFLNRYSPVAPKGVRFELRTGMPGERIVEVAADGRRARRAGLAPGRRAGRATIVREVLAHSPIPVVLFPILTETDVAVIAPGSSRLLSVPRGLVHG